MLTLGGSFQKIPDPKDNKLADGATVDFSLRTYTFTIKDLKFRADAFSNLGGSSSHSIHPISSLCTGFPAEVIKGEIGEVTVQVHIMLYNAVVHLGPDLTKEWQIPLGLSWRLEPSMKDADFEDKFKVA